MSKIFNIKSKSKISKARTGELSFFHGKIQTPVFMSIGTIGSVKGLTSDDLIRLDAQIILGNTYHLWLRPGMDTMQALENKNHNESFGNLHKFINWQRPILTDSGGFQAFSLSKIRKFTDQGVFFQAQTDGKKRFLSPEISMQIQSILGSDVALVLDECLPAEVTQDIAKGAMKRTFEWAKRSKLEFERIKKQGIEASVLLELEKSQSEFAQKAYTLGKNRTKDGRQKYTEFLEKNEFPMLNSQNLTESYFNSYDRYLFGIPQGAQFNNLRVESAKMTMELDFPGYSIGGVANGGEPEEIMYNQVLSQTEVLEEEKPKHLLGVGTPKDIIEMVKRGIDMFDCVYPTRNARHGSIFIWIDKENLQYQTLKIQSSKFEKDFSPINSESNLHELKNYTKAYLRHLFKAKELLAYRLATLNNLEFYYDLMRLIRDKINSGKM
jgi:queuine tRNA-ribosyltransferase